MFENVDLDDLWYEGDNPDADEYECGNPVSDDLVKNIEDDLGVILPGSYIFLMRQHNGGILKRNCVQINRKRRYYDIEGIFGLGREHNHSIYEENKEKSYYEENLIAIGSTISGDGRIYLDYGECGGNGEPRVIAIDTDHFDAGDPDPKPLELAKDFESFIRSLREYDEDKETDVKFAPDDTIHKLVKKKVLIESNMWLIIAAVIIVLSVVIGYCYDIFILKLPIGIIPVMLIMFIASSSDILKRKYKCWYDEIEEIKEENGIINYVLKDTDRKMYFIISKKEKINVGDKFLCMTDGYAFKYDPNNP